jgi:hypothetical protein
MTSARAQSHPPDRAARWWLAKEVRQDVMMNVNCERHDETRFCKVFEGR